MIGTKGYKVQQLGNVKLKVGNEADAKVFKCPHLRCDRFFFAYDDLKAHEALDHGELPQYMTQNNQRQSITGIRGELARIRLRQRLNHLKDAMDLYWEYKQAAKGARKPQSIESKPGLMERISLFLAKRRGGKAGRGG